MKNLICTTVFVLFAVAMGQAQNGKAYGHYNKTEKEYYRAQDKWHKEQAKAERKYYKEMRKAEKEYWKRTGHHGVVRPANVYYPVPAPAPSGVDAQVVLRNGTAVRVTF